MKFVSENRFFLWSKYKTDTSKVAQSIKSGIGTPLTEWINSIWCCFCFQRLFLFQTIKLKKNYEFTKIRVKWSFQSLDEIFHSFHGEISLNWFSIGIFLKFFGIFWFAQKTASKLNHHVSQHNVFMFIRLKCFSRLILYFDFHISNGILGLSRAISNSKNTSSSRNSYLY